jgi:hypothetical protein
MKTRDQSRNIVPTSAEAKSTTKEIWAAPVLKILPLENARLDGFTAKDSPASAS